ncbi:ABC transporter ATP-binding protein [Listeria weihenstephanensis FSL R9-0317]|uniref:ABC transporter ATP-binding protein n=1 Tax=Listeria weihenstephanensis TaxID=1006155 RepID=A0A1S7FVZ6_9LIST|nr:ABC transporter ATP-binding protein [Listeria weihenstephanensis]AQY51598.1 molybdenum ABC transporter ATP-binding protein [Listeria weihenstephanensis]EUJ34880.1 ABC transporter ATP-binding protein [Listeria weihenstephanensis FSL R9-0317]MBC1502044.1 ABC transporter ATP-binding protein [Listeria weihenstephanensis]
MFEFNQVCLKRDGRFLLESIDWKVCNKENWAVLGLNGSGKTTLLKLLNGYLWPSSGSLDVLGHRFGETSLPELRKSIGWVSSSLQQQLKEYDLAEVIVVSGKFASIGLYQGTTIEERESARKILIDCGGEDLIGKRYSILSQGERQIVLIARALMATPELLILDEPCTGLDIFAKKRLLDRISTIAKLPSAPTILYVTHHTEEILPCFGHTLLLRGGKKYDSGLTSTMLTTEKLSSFYNHDVDVITLENGQISVFPK